MLDPVKPKEWNPSLAAHLLRRAGFGAPPEAIDSFASMKPADAVARVVHYESQFGKEPGPIWAAGPDADLRFNEQSLVSQKPKAREAAMQEQRALEKERLINLQRWWLRRMRYTVSPLEEKLTLFWHGHFATSFEKVREVYALYQQNQTFRRHAAGNFGDLVTSVAQDPAMLFYLDNAISNKNAPNENFARELMELFTLGEGNYTEKDIMEAARALTGWSVERRRNRFQFRPENHDGGKKTFMSFTGHLDGHDVINEILEHPACPEFIASKLWRFFAYDDVSPELARSLGQTLYRANFELRPLLEKIFMSREFYSWEAAHAQIKSPVQWLVGTAIALEGDLPDETACSMIMRTLGQELFIPPNVKGWDGGVAWINAASLMQRYNLAGFMVKGASGMMGEEGGMPPIADLQKVLPVEKRRTLNGALEYLEWRLFQSRMSETEKMTLKMYLTTLTIPSRWSDEDLRNLLHIMMSTPYYQVC